MERTDTVDALYGPVVPHVLCSRLRVFCELPGVNPPLMIRSRVAVLRLEVSQSLLLVIARHNHTDLRTLWDPRAVRAAIYAATVNHAVVLRTEAIRHQT